MSNVHPINPTVNPSIDDVCAWLEGKATRGEVPATTSRIRVTALKQLSGILTEDEPRDAKSVLRDLPNIARRWATLNSSMKGDTASTYESRAKTALEDYFRFLEDPKKFQFRRRETSSGTDGSESPKLPRKPSKPARSEPAQAPPERSDEAFRTFPLSNGREVKFVLPSDLTMKDVRKFVLHLATFAGDFDPDVPPNAQVFAIVRGE